MSDPEATAARENKKGGFLRRLGPGLITGASDDDPGGIATYSQAGAGFGYGLLWTMFLTLPLMAAIQEISARVGRVTGRGIAGNMSRHYPAWLLHPLVALLLVANTINLGADIGAMGDATRLLFGGPALLYSATFAAGTVALQVFGSYARCSSIFKFLSLVLLSYVLTSFLVHADWAAVVKSTIIPRFQRGSDYWATMIAVLGTTISPYLFFWQAEEETEEMRNHDEQQPLKKAPEQARDQLSRIRFDTYVGMAFSNIVAFFIIVAAGATLYPHGIHTIETSEQAAEALRPLAGKAAFLLFTCGIIGTGLLAVPVLAGSAAYAVGQAMHWPTGMDRKPHAAKGFYAVMIFSTLIGLCIDVPRVQRWTGLSPVRMLFWSAVINGVVAVPIMVVVMLMSRNQKIMGHFGAVSRPLHAMGWIATAVMALAAVMIVVTSV